ncbi:hypothetical protein GCM10010407_07490 [Rarobacter incanus]
MDGIGWERWDVRTAGLLMPWLDELAVLTINGLKLVLRRRQGMPTENHPGHEKALARNLLSPGHLVGLTGFEPATP